MKSIKYLSLMASILSVVTFGLTSCDNDDVEDSTPAHKDCF